MRSTTLFHNFPVQVVVEAVLGAAVDDPVRAWREEGLRFAAFSVANYATLSFVLFENVVVAIVRVAEGAAHGGVVHTPFAPRFRRHVSAAPYVVAKVQHGRETAPGGLETELGTEFRVEFTAFVDLRETDETAQGFWKKQCNLLDNKSNCHETHQLRGKSGRAAEKV